MTSARIQPFCKKYIINIGYYDGFRVCPRNITERNIALYMYKNYFCLIWKSNGISFNKAIEELKINFKVVDNVTSGKHVESFIKYEYKPKKIQSQLTTMIVLYIETFNTDRAVPYVNCIYKLSKISGKYNRDITEIYQKSRKDCIAFKGTDSINEMLDDVLQFKGAAKRVNRKIVKYNLYILAHNSSDFDSYVVLNNLPQWRTVVSLIKNGSGLVSLEIFNGYVDENNELEHDEIYEDTWEDKENECLPYLKNDVLSTAFSYGRYAKGMEKLTGFGMKNSLTLATLANKYFNSLGDENDEPIYTYNHENMRHFVSKA